ncbi:MAG: glycoside hydrolase family 9 protein [Rhodobacteraceae bacterium]|nr:glycoside hydrolase family 9 protein [Paracoccaceae bacterium]
MLYPATISDSPNAIFARLYAERAIAVAHVGYELTQAKVAVACLADGPALVACRLRDADTGAVLVDCILGQPGPVAGWAGQTYQSVDFSACTTACNAVLEGVDTGGGLLISAAFPIGAGIHATTMPQAILSYFQGQRCAGKYDLADRAIPFIGTKVAGTVDVHGGWYDASGDVSKYLSHLSYANYMNPQQTPLVVWALARASGSAVVGAEARAGLQAEARWGADFLVRMCRPEGMFCMTVFDRWSGDTAQREICSYSTQQGHKHDSWECGWRQGGGMAIAALARVSRLGLDGAFTAQDYLATAERAFDHLLAHGLAYLDDGRENIIDDYCALLAAHELALTTGKDAYRAHAAQRAEQLLARMSSGHGRDGWWRSGDDDSRPFTHAADEGLPLLALALYAPTAPAALKDRITSALGRAANHLLSVTAEVHNPFAYPRHFTRQPDGSVGTQFFHPHVNESGYWWQGENARLGSLACALRAIQPLVDLPPAVQALPSRYLGWILGANPFHASMMHGFGRNQSHYLPAKTPTSAGAICNGITSGLTDEGAIAYCPTEDPFHSWRWSELWLPHATWFLLAITEPKAAAL